MAITKIKSSNITDDSITAAKIADGTVVAADIADGTITDAKIGALNASKLTGSIADARVPASAVTQHVTGYDDASIRSDILKLALHQAIDGNRVAYNLDNSFIDGFEDDTGITTETNVDRNTSGEYVSSITGTAPDSNYVFVVQSDTTNNSTTFTDESANAHALTVVGDTKHSTTEEKIGATSIYFDGTSDYIHATNNHADFAFGTGDFTIEMWAWQPSQVVNKQLICNRQDAGTPVWNFFTSAGYQLGFATGNAILLHGTATVPASTWTHCAVTRDSGTLRMYFNGVQETTAANTTDFHSNLKLRIGGSDTQGTTNWNGYLDGIRVSKTCRYPSGTSFTPYTTNLGLTTSATGTLISDPQTASSSRTSCSGVIIYSDASGTATLGTDLKIYFTCNNGTNWIEAASYGTATTYSGTKKLVKLGATTCTAGTQVAMKAVWANQASGSKETRLEGWAVNY